MTRITEIKKSFGKDKNGKIYAPFETNYLVPELLGLVEVMVDALEKCNKTLFSEGIVGEPLSVEAKMAIDAALAKFKAWNEVV